MSHEKTGLSGKVETEVALIIRDHAEQTAQKLAHLFAILDCPLVHRRSLTIRDTYFDTESRFFTRNRITFRIRRSGHGTTLSAKSSPRKISGGETSRVEIEKPWSYQSLASITEKLGLKPPSKQLFTQSASSPSRILTKAGFFIVQDRLTRRKSRDLVMIRKGKTSRFAELSIDNVTYKLTEGTVRLIEVEIEAKASRAMPRIRPVVDWLLSEYPSLRLWPHGKFVTGLAINRLLRNRNRRDLTREGLVKPGVFGLLDRTIREGSL